MNSPEPIPAFWTERTGELALYLRRYRASDQGKCPARGYHNAMVPVGVTSDASSADGIVVPVSAYAGDPRWPALCECGEPFTPEDHWQVFTDRLYTRPDTGERWPMRELPVGAMYDAQWEPDLYRGPDGIALVVICPPALECHNQWLVDGPARPPNGEAKYPAWSRTGDPRVAGSLTCAPSIEIGFSRDGDGNWSTAGECYYHGFLQGGVLTPG